jgi:hypothetical protein
MAIMIGRQATLLSMDSPDTRVGAPDQRVVHAPPPRVTTTLNNITAPNIIQQMPLVHQCHNCKNNLFQILAANNDDDVAVVASNCLGRPLTTAPTRALASPSIIPAITPATPHAHIHDLQPKPPRTPNKPPVGTKRTAHSLPIVEPDDERDKVPTMRTPPPHNAPPGSLPGKPRATFCAKHCIMLLVLDSLTPLPSQSPVVFPKSSLQVQSWRL